MIQHANLQLVDVYIGIGSNSNPEKNILKAFHLLKEMVSVTRTSMFYYTIPLKNKNQEEFCNGVWKICTSMKPHILKFDVLRHIESVLGRIRGEDKYASRPIDLDILLYGDQVIHTEDLVIPDQDIYTRPFVCIPVSEITPDLVLPDTGKTIREIASHMSNAHMRLAEHITSQLQRGVSNG